MLNKSFMLCMIKDVIADHFSGNPQAGCRVPYPISRFYVQVDWICKQLPTFGSCLNQRFRIPR
jgi:hypothetical protein